MEQYQFEINDHTYHTIIKHKTYNRMDVEVNGQLYSVKINASMPTVEKPEESKGSDESNLSTVSSTGTSSSAIKQNANILPSPLPGMVTRVNVRLEQEIKNGDLICTMEAMKMENEIRSFRDGRVTNIFIKVGDALQEGAPICEIS